MPFREIISPLASSKTLGYVAMLALLMGIYSTTAVWKEHSPLRDVGDIPSDIHAALSLILGWLLVFRTNAAYGRWWEARTQWGSLVNATRNLAMKLNEYGQPNQDDREFLSARLTGFSESLKSHLRNLNNTEPRPALSSTRTEDHSPLKISQEVFSWLHRQHRDGKISGDVLRAIDQELSKWMDVCGACERIVKTPMVRSYRIFARQCIALFLFTFPWGIANDFGAWTIPLTVITAYFMIGMETVAEHVEEPFGLDDDDLDLEALCQTIRRSVNQILTCVGSAGTH